MKKVAFLAIVMILAISSYALAAGTALSANAVTSKDGSQIYGGVDAADAARDNGVLLGKMSKGVNFRARFTSADFAAATYHGSGSKAYGTAYNSTAIYFQDVGDKAAAEKWSLSHSTNESFGAAWTAM